MKEIWNGETYKKFRKATNDKNAPLPKPCSECRSYSSPSRLRNQCVLDFDQKEMATFKSNKTSAIIASLKEPPRKKKIYIKDITKYQNQAK